MIAGPAVPPRSGEQARQLVVLLHGYGADGADLIGLAGPLGEALPDALFAAPDAPARCAQNPFGFEWFGIDFNDLDGSARDGVPRARGDVIRYLDEQWSRTGLGPRDTFLCGFSQGAMVALHVGLGLSEAPMGIVAFSGALVPPEGLETPRSTRPPVCLVHGEMDEVVPTHHTPAAAERLGAAGYAVDVHVTPGLAHGIAPDGLAFAARFMRARASTGI